MMTTKMIASRLQKARHRARLQGVGGTVTSRQLQARFAYYGELCWVCHAPAEAIDHVKPFAAGGAHLACNIRPICMRCNSGKGSLWRGVRFYGR